MSWKFWRKADPRLTCNRMAYGGSTERHSSFHICGRDPGHFGSHVCQDKKCYYSWFSNERDVNGNRQV